MNTLFLAELINPNTNILVILPEIIVAVAGVIVMLYDSFFPKQRAVTGIISLVGLVVAGLFLALMWTDVGGSPGAYWNGMIAHDNLRLGFSFVLLLVSAMTILISTVWVENEDVPIGEYHALLMFATFGMLLMAAGNDLVVIFLGLETSSIATYVMAGLRKSDLKSNESAMKYFILGSFASAFLLYGMALIYGATGSTNITEIAVKVADANFPALLLIGAAMLIIGFGFKVATVPFHIWTPDVYEGAPSPITGFMAAGPKAAAFASFVRIFVIGFPLIAGVQASGYLHDTWMTALKRHSDIDDDDRQSRGDNAEQYQTNAGLFVDRPCGIRACRIHRSRHGENGSGTRRSRRLGCVLYVDLCDNESWSFRDNHFVRPEERPSNRV